jgi:hypothetical protein
MRRIVFVLGAMAVMAMLVAAMAAPAFAAQPEGGCPSGGGFVEKTQPLPSGFKGNSDQLNSSTDACFNELENAPQPLKDIIGVDPIEIVIEDVVR